MSCTTPKNVHVDDVGTVFRVTIKEDGVAKDISSYEAVTFRFKKPDKTYLDVPGTVEDAPNGLVSYTSLADDLDQAGRWYLEVFVDMPNWEVRSDPISFWVHPNL